jgi:hypothetical protein
MRDISGLISALNALVTSKGSPEAAGLVHSILRYALLEQDQRIFALESTVSSLRRDLAAIRREMHENKA